MGRPHIDCRPVVSMTDKRPACGTVRRQASFQNAYREPIVQSNVLLCASCGLSEAGMATLVPATRHDHALAYIHELCLMIVPFLLSRSCCSTSSRARRCTCSHGPSNRP